MLNRTLFAAACNPKVLAAKPLRLFFIGAPKLSDSDPTLSKVLEKAAHDLKTREEERWLDTLATISGKKTEDEFFFHTYVSEYFFV